MTKDIGYKIAAKSEFKFKEVEIMEQHFDPMLQEFTSHFENLAYTNAAPENFKQSFEDLVASIIGVTSVPGEKIFRLGTAVKKKYPDVGDALRVSGIMAAYYH